LAWSACTRDLKSFVYTALACGFVDHVVVPQHGDVEIHLTEHGLSLGIALLDHSWRRYSQTVGPPTPFGGPCRHGAASLSDESSPCFYRTHSSCISSSHRESVAVKFRESSWRTWRSICQQRFGPDEWHAWFMRKLPAIRGLSARSQPACDVADMCGFSAAA